MRTKHMLVLAMVLVGPFCQEARAFYNSHTGRWLSRDPMGERGGASLSGFVKNSPVNCVDLIGLFSHSHNCNAKQLDSLRVAEFVAEFYSTWALLVLNTKFNTWDVIGRNAEFARRYESEPAFANMYRGWLVNALVTFRMMGGGFVSNQHGVECECWCDADTEAYVKPDLIWLGLDDDIHFCPLYFKLAPRQQANTFLHEFSHYYAFTDDLALGGRMPFEMSPRDAYWIGDVVGTNPFEYFDQYVSVNMVLLFPRP